MGLGGQRHAPAALPPGKTRCPFYRRLGGPQGRSGRARKISPPHRNSRKISPPPQEFDPRTVKPVASCYTDCAIPAHQRVSYIKRNAVFYSRSVQEYGVDVLSAGGLCQGRINLQKKKKKRKNLGDT